MEKLLLVGTLGLQGKQNPNPSFGEGLRSSWKSIEQ
ncbi:predicted protein [Botrytis cinerea T4]|uniref:Uncharacterized protein n=1 Tax=Botryotinia fuckeliana (strain T4) TaxID=999810 RepID=G2XZH9_BOTF4|nr:predicted protein [Botrytis cinerea T4]